MASNLLIRNIDPKLISALAERAARHGRTLEEEHDEILRKALQRPDPQEFIERARMLRAALAPQLFQAFQIDAAKRAGRK